MMAKKDQDNVVNLREKEGGDSKRTIKAIAKKVFDALLRKVKSAQAGMDSERGTIGQLVAAAVEKDHLHKGAFGIFRRLDKMDASKRAELLFHFDIYRERADWDTSDLFEDRDGSAQAAE